jgi:hypothetical protein
MSEAASAANMRTFELNSREFYEAVCAPPDPWVWAGGLPREPRPREREVVVEARKRSRR